MSKSRVEDPSEMLAVGELVYCKVISLEVSCKIMYQQKLQKHQNNRKKNSKTSESKYMDKT